jgi:hypothetical protein
VRLGAHALTQTLLHPVIMPMLKHARIHPSLYGTTQAEKPAALTRCARTVASA